MFYRTSFHWNPKRLYDSSEEDIEKAVTILNTLTPEQIKAVELFGKSRYEEGYDDGDSERYDYSK